MTTTLTHIDLIDKQVILKLIDDSKGEDFYVLLNTYEISYRQPKEGSYIFVSHGIYRNAPYHSLQAHFEYIDPITNKVCYNRSIPTDCFLDFEIIDKLDDLNQKIAVINSYKEIIA